MKKYLTYTIISILAVSLLSVGIVSANGWFGKAAHDGMTQKHKGMFEYKAEALGMTIEELKQAWYDSKDLSEIAEDQGITLEELREQMKEQKKERMLAYMQTLVDEGKITQEQADEKIEWMQNMSQNWEGKSKEGFIKGMRWHGGGFGK